MRSSLFISAALMAALASAVDLRALVVTETDVLAATEAFT